MGYAEDSNYKPKPKKTALVGKTNAKQAAYYRKQRLDAEAGEKKGNTAATRTAAKIHQKTGRALTGAEGDLTLKPGASEGEQMGNLAMGLGGIGDMGGVVARGLSRAAEDVASHAAMRLPSGTRELSPAGRMALPSGEAKSSLGPAMRRLKGGSQRAIASTERKALPKPKELTPAKRTASPKHATAKAAPKKKKVAA
jgi:hypothetical protein